MNTAIKTKERNFSKDLGAVSEDWSVLGELSEKSNKYVLKNRKNNNLNVTKTAAEIMEQSLQEDEGASHEAQADDAMFEHNFLAKPVQVNTGHNMTNHIANHIANDVAPENNHTFFKGHEDEIKKESTVRENTSKTVDNLLQPGVQNTLSHRESLAEKNKEVAQISLQEEFSSRQSLVRLIAIGLTKLYVKKTSTVLDPVKFVVDNFKDVSIASIHLGIPALMTWLLMTQVGFIAEQVSQVSSPIFWLYAAVFYFASLFTWVTSQVVGAGFVAMLKTTLVAVARDVQRQKE